MTQVVRIYDPKCDLHKKVKYKKVLLKKRTGVKYGPHAEHIVCVILNRKYY